MAGVDRRPEARRRFRDRVRCGDADGVEALRRGKRRDQPAPLLGAQKSS
jgi:hypothetical protein